MFTWCRTGEIFLGNQRSDFLEVTFALAKALAKGDEKKPLYVTPNNMGDLAWFKFRFPVEFGKRKVTTHDAIHQRLGKTATLTIVFDSSCVALDESNYIILTCRCKAIISASQ